MPYVCVYVSACILYTYVRVCVFNSNCTLDKRYIHILYTNTSAINVVLQLFFFLLLL